MILILSGRSRTDFTTSSPSFLSTRVAPCISAKRSSKHTLGFQRTLANTPLHNSGRLRPDLLLLPFPMPAASQQQALCQISPPVTGLLARNGAPALSIAQVFRNYYFPQYFVKYFFKKVFLFSLGFALGLTPPVSLRARAFSKIRLHLSSVSEDFFIGQVRYPTIQI